jgi:hypothetical protein
MGHGKSVARTFDMNFLAVGGHTENPLHGAI